jgi:hypothetical protein
MIARREDRKPVYDRALLLYGPKRDEVLTLEEVQQYGIDSFSEPDYLRIYGMAPSVWFAQGIRLLGRTAVECTRDALGNRIGKDIASIAARLPKTTHFTVIDRTVRASVWKKCRAIQPGGRGWSRCHRRSLNRSKGSEKIFAMLIMGLVAIGALRGAFDLSIGISIPI